MLSSLVPVIFPFSTMIPSPSRNISSPRRTGLARVSWNRLIIQVPSLFSQLEVFYDWTIPRCVGVTSAPFGKILPCRFTERSWEDSAWKVMQKSGDSTIIIMPNYRCYEALVIVRGFAAVWNLICFDCTLLSEIFPRHELGSFGCIIFDLHIIQSVHFVH